MKMTLKTMAQLDFCQFTFLLLLHYSHIQTYLKILSLQLPLETRSGKWLTLEKLLSSEVAVLQQG